VSEVYQASETAPSASEAGATAPYDAGSGPASADNTGSYIYAAPGDDFAGYSDADIDAILAAEEQLPEPRTRQEAAAATWDDSPDDPAGSDEATEYDGDVAALLAAGEHLPEPRTRQEAAAATWDDTTQPGDDDPGSFVGDPASEYDGDVAALLAAEEQLPEPRTRQEAAAATWDDTGSDLNSGPDTSSDGTSPSQPDAVTEPSAGNYADPASEQGTAHTERGTEKSQFRDADLAAASSDPAKQTAESLPHQEATGENYGGVQDGHAARGNHSEDGSPPDEPRTEQQAPGGAQADAATLSQDASETIVGTDGDEGSEAGQDQTPHVDSSPDEPPADERARLHQMYQDYRKEYGSGWGQGTNVVGDKPSRSPGDTSDLPPTGEELVEMEDDSGSHLEKLRRKIYERVDDISDGSEEYGGTLAQLLERPPTETHTLVPTTPHDMPNHQEHGVDGGHLATAGLVVGVLGFELFRTINNRVRAWRGR
jgi:hypothetical protein